jgi:DNA repair photolyase
MGEKAIQAMLPFDEPEPTPEASGDAETMSTSNTSQERRTKLGRSTIEYVSAHSILTKSSGFMEDYDYTLNPYSGCTFGCTYCYAAFFARERSLQDSWGYWVRVKENALELLQRKRKRPLTGKTIYMSSVTDPYQPIERDLGLTRSLLEELEQYHKPRIVIQTRSPIVTRDIDLFMKFEFIQVNMTITTDDEEVRRLFEPSCSSIKARLAAITEVQKAGIPSCITMTPLLPVQDPVAFAMRLLDTGVKKFIIQPFHTEKGRFIAGTREDAVRLFREKNWNSHAYQQTLSTIKKYIPQITEGKIGFAPI